MDLKTFSVIFIAAAALGVGANRSLDAHSLAESEQQLFKSERYVEIVDRAPPEFSLKDPSGRIVSLSDYLGKVVVLDFIYASCTDACPLQTQKLIEIQEKISNSDIREQVQFISITTDPVTDTPEALVGYQDRQGINPENWILLTSGPDKPEATRVLAKKYGLKFTPTEDGQQTHGVVTHVIDKEGRMRARYHGLNFKSANLIGQVDDLAKDNNKHDIAARENVFNAKPIVPVAAEKIGYYGRPVANSGFPVNKVLLLVLGVIFVVVSVGGYQILRRKSASR